MVNNYIRVTRGRKAEARDFFFFFNDNDELSVKQAATKAAAMMDSYGVNPTVAIRGLSVVVNAAVWRYTAMLPAYQRSINGDEARTTPLHPRDRVEA